MKPFIGINQERIVKSGLDMDLSHAAILDFICNIHNWKSVVMMVDENKTYYWVSHDLIIQNLPLLKIKKDTVYRKVKELIGMGLIVSHPNSQKMGKTYLMITDKTKDLLFTPSDATSPVNSSQSDPSDLNPKVYSGNPQVNPENDQNGGSDLRTEIRTPTDLNPNYKTIEYKTIEEEEKNKIKKEFLFPFPIDEQFLHSLTEDITLDHEGQAYVVRPFKFLQSLDYETILQECHSGKGGARVSDTYRHIVQMMMNEKYQEEKDEELRQMNE